METIEYRTLDKSKWGNGEWQNEPDKKQWQDKGTGLPCLAVRHPGSGHWCGYVGVNKSHQYYEKPYDDVPIECHGGLTFSDKCEDVDDECHGICHKAPPGEDDVWWLGFDCAHYGDKSPAYRDISIITLYESSTYKTLEFVENECANIAKQLAGVN